jgi:hypothetical protein
MSHDLRRIDRGARMLATLGLLIALATSLVAVHRFGQERFFTIDEYQFGHATWLVSEGHRPYVDFYEHHFPLSYVLHAPFLFLDGSFPERALRLRLVPFAYLALLCAVVGIAAYGVTRTVHAALLTALAPLVVGFSLMSAVDYRADNFAACLFVACLALLEANRIWNRRGVAQLCGALFMVAVFMTQKMAIVGGGTLAIFGALDAARPRLARGAAVPAPFVRRPAAFAAAAAGVVVAVIGAGALLGVLPAAWEATVLDAVWHERLYPTSSPIGRFWRPFWTATTASTLAIAAFSMVFVAGGRDGFWRVPIAVALLAAAFARAQYPYNYVLLADLLAVCAARGFALAVEALPRRRAFARALRPLLYLLPLAVLPQQYAFLTRASSNEQQLNLLRKIEAFSSEDDAVIDNAGGALFRNHGSYYFHHGKAHRLMFADYFADEIIEDYRRSRALFWISDFRLGQVPRSVRVFWRRHYVPLDGSLYTLGFSTPRTGDAQVKLEIDVIRAGDYHVHPARPADARAQPRVEGEAPGRLVIESREVSGGTVRLEERRYRVTVLPHSPPMFLSLLPPEGFEPWVSGTLHHTRLFEFRAPAP